MGIFSSISDALGSALSRGLSKAVSLCASIGSKVKVMYGVSKFLEGVPELELAVEVIRAIGKIIVAVSDILLEKPAEEAPEDLGMKAEKCFREERLEERDFESAQAYIEYLRSEIKLDPAEKEGLSEEELQKYAAVGVGLYVQAMEERYGVKLEPEFWRAVYRTRLTADQIPTLITAMQEGEMTDGAALDGYLSGELKDTAVWTRAYDVLEAYTRAAGGTTTVRDLRQSYLREEQTGDSQE